MVINISISRLLSGGQLLFDDFQLSFPTGQCLFILGMNGVGKTTLLRHIANKKANEIAWMGQRDSLLPWLSVQDNICIGSRLRHGRITPDERDRARSLIEAVGLNGYGAARPSMLSGGMRQKVALARTLYENKDIILMDEPFSALDAISRDEMRRLCNGFLRGKTMICVTHDPLDAWILADRVIVLNGRPARIALDLSLPSQSLRNLADSGPTIDQMMTALALASDIRGSA